MFVGFKSQDLVKVAHDFDRSEHGLLPNAVRKMEKVGEQIQDDARQRLVRYAENKSLKAERVADVSAPGIRQATGIKADNDGVYTSVGQTIFRKSVISMQRPKWSLVMQERAIEPALGGVARQESVALDAMEQASNVTFGENNLY